mgnify:CR=1 FL=1
MLNSNFRSSLITPFFAAVALTVISFKGISPLLNKTRGNSKITPFFAETGSGKIIFSETGLSIVSLPESPPPLSGWGSGWGITGGCTNFISKLLLVTCLLLQDIQRWQDLWYENKVEGTPLYVVAPMVFHDAMNRLNASWGHGAFDYQYRAANSLGDNAKPLFEPNIELPNYREQGLSLEQFRQKVEEFL